MKNIITLLVFGRALLASGDCIELAGLSFRCIFWVHIHIKIIQRIMTILYIENQDMHIRGTINWTTPSRTEKR